MGSPTSPSWPPDLKPTTEGDTLAAMSAEDAVRLIGRPPADQADAAVLPVVGGLTTAEVAVVMRKRAGTVRVLQHRGPAPAGQNSRRTAVTNREPRAVTQPMGSGRLDVHDLEALLSGVVARDDTPPGSARVAEMLDAARRYGSAPPAELAPANPNANASAGGDHPGEARGVPSP